MLTAELEVEHASISEQLPRSPFNQREVLPQFARSPELRLRDRRTAEFHSPTIAPVFSGRDQIYPDRG